VAWLANKLGTLGHRWSPVIRAGRSFTRVVFAKKATRYTATSARCGISVQFV